jgi:hypothetical protein
VHPVIGGPWFFTKNDKLESGTGRDQLFAEFMAYHSIANDHHNLFVAISHKKILRDQELKDGRLSKKYKYYI